MSRRRHPLAVARSRWDDARASIRFIVPEAEKSRYAAQAARERKSLGEWMREAAARKLRSSFRGERSRSREEFDRILREARERAGPGREPDWEDTKQGILDGKMEGVRIG